MEVGFNDGRHRVGSDVRALLAHRVEVIVPEPGNYVVIAGGSSREGET